MAEDLAEIDLGAVNFTAAETVLASAHGMTASAFRYASGVAALRLRNSRGSVVLLPFHGQQIWDAEFLGRRLTMKTMFDEPVDTGDYLGNYGGFFLHCGLMAMGNPGAADSHPLHGEIPNASYQQASLLIGQVDGVPCMGLAGTRTQRTAFTAHYRATPRLLLQRDASWLDMTLSVRNLFHRPMSLMYLAHINFRPADGGTLHDAVPDDPRHIRLRTTLPTFFTPSDGFKAMIAELSADPARHRHIVAGRPVDPELVMGLDYPAGPDGIVHTLMEHPDGSGDFVSHHPAELPRAVRWMTRTEDQDAIGIVLPATAEADGFTAENAKGNVKWLGFDESWSCRLRFGALDRTATASLKQEIAAARSPR
jgi:hypothetical protein